VRPELRRKVMAKIKAVYVPTVSSLTVADTYFSEKQKMLMVKSLWREQQKQSEQFLRLIPDKAFEAIMTDLDSLPEKTHKVVKESLRQLPKDRGGRPPAFPVEIRKSAIQDVGNEYPRCNSFSEAIDVVAARYKMTPEYLRKVWKNRKRLRQREV
jgi:hypothetical protein